MDTMRLFNNILSLKIGHDVKGEVTGETVREHIEKTIKMYQDSLKTLNTTYRVEYAKNINIYERLLARIK